MDVNMMMMMMMMILKPTATLPHLKCHHWDIRDKMGQVW